MNRNKKGLHGRILFDLYFFWEHSQRLVDPPKILSKLLFVMASLVEGPADQKLQKLMLETLASSFAVSAVGSFFKATLLGRYDARLRPSSLSSSSSS
mmetsp:Transcript_21947/g.38651  ORF Transcript_21947/g.38651 Transcript_21947/m.38651 type:complete len:97 (+) Transcript_21947:218-508(+)